MNPEVPSPESFDELDIIGRLEDISEGDINELKEKIDENRLHVFEKLGEMEKKILVLISKCSDNELKELLRLNEDNGKLMAIHDIKTHFHTLSMLISDKRFINMMEDYKKEKEE